MKTFADFGIDVPSHRGGEIDTTCPECSHTRKKKRAKCLSVNLDKGVWHCAHCGWSGGLENGIERHELHWQKPAFRKPDPLPDTELSDKALAWMESRGITREVINRNKISSQLVWIPQIEQKTGAIAYPYFRDGELINCKYRDGQKNFRMEAGAERILYGLDDVTDTVVIVEGEMDKLSVEVAGIKSCVSVPDGAPSENTKDYSSKFTFLETAEKKLQEVKQFIIAVDSDAPGKRLEDELSRRLGRHRCSRVTWPSDCKDANEVLLTHGKDVLKGCLDNAQQFPIDGVFSVSDVNIFQLYENGWELGNKTGWVGVDELYTVRPGEFTVVTGIPNSGKSNWLDALLVNLAEMWGWSFALFSPENQPLDDHMARIIEKYIREPFNKGPTKRMSRDALRSGSEWAENHFSWILPDDDAEWSVDNILDIAKELVYRKGIRGLVIDPWNELESVRPSSMSETEYVSHVLKRVRQFGRHHGVHIWIVAHPAKLYRQSDGNYPLPSMYDISGSAHWRNKADNGVCIWRDMSRQTDVVEVHIQKIRFKQIGKIGMTPLRYSHITQTYSELSDHAKDQYIGGIL